MDRLSLSLASSDEDCQARSCNEQRESRRLRHGQDLTANLAVRLPCGGDVLIPQTGFELSDLGVSERKWPGTERRGGRATEAIKRRAPKAVAAMEHWPAEIENDWSICSRQSRALDITAYGNESDSRDVDPKAQEAPIQRESSGRGGRIAVRRHFTRTREHRLELDRALGLRLEGAGQQGENERNIFQACRNRRRSTDAKTAPLPSSASTDGSGTGRIWPRSWPSGLAAEVIFTYHSPLSS